MADPKETIKVEDVLKTLGIKGEFETIKQFNAEFNKDFIKRDDVPNDDELAGKITGKRISIIEQSAKKAIKAMGIDIAKEDWADDMSVEDKIKKATEKAKEHFDGEVQAAKDANTGDVDKTVTKLTDKLKIANSDLTQMTEARDGLQEELGKTKTDQDKKLKSIMISTEVTKIKGDITWKQDISPIEKNGFDAHLKEKFKFEIQEEGEGDNKKVEVVVKDNDGKMIANDSKSGAFLTPKELIEQEAAANNLTKKNGAVEKENKSGHQKPKPEDSEHKPGKYDVPIHENATAAAEKSD